MSYIDQDRSRERVLSGTLSALVVGAVGYALATGLAVNIATIKLPDLIVRNWRAEAPPPPPPPTPTQRTTPHTETQTRIPATVPPVHDLSTDTSVLRTQDSGPTIPLDTGKTIEQPFVLPAHDLSSGVSPAGRPGDWVTTDDYPAASVRAGQEGRTAFRLDIDVNGRPTACTVTASSGSDALDREACRLLMRRARFNAAHGADGMPVASTYEGGVTWKLPTD